MALASDIKYDIKDLLNEAGASGWEASTAVGKTTNHTPEAPNYHRRIRVSGTSLFQGSNPMYGLFDGSNVYNVEIKDQIKASDKEMEAKPMPLLTSYIEAAMAEAQYEPFEGDTFYAFIPSCPGVWSNECTIDDCKRDLREALEFWLILKLRDNDYIPVINGLDLNSIEELEV